MEPYKQLDFLLKKYLVNIKSPVHGIASEFEIRFNTPMKGTLVQPLTSLNYYNLIQWLKSAGFTIVNNSPEDLLRIEPVNSQHLRVEIRGIDAIKTYCKTNDIKHIIENHGSDISFIQKTREEEPVLFPTFQMKASLQEEKTNSRWNLPTGLVDNWMNTKKTFRYLSRVSMVDSNPLMRVDISIVKTSEKSKRGGYIATYTLQQSKLFENDPEYEAEIELSNDLILKSDETQLMPRLKLAIKHVLSGLQQSEYPINYSEMFEVGQSYKKLLQGKEYERGQLYKSNFIGPSPKTLRLHNIMEPGVAGNAVNVRHNYTVTDKADGVRTLLYIHESGKLYTINMNMMVKFTGIVLTNTVAKLKNTVIDGEYIQQVKSGLPLYAAFDIYYVAGKDVRELPFTGEKGRLKYLTETVNALALKHISGGDLPLPMNIRVKHFEITSDKKTIFECCKNVLAQQEVMPYNTDGLIFTPALLGVGSEKIGEAGPKHKITWKYAFKWKPPQYNTIDFLVTTLKDSTGADLRKIDIDGRQYKELTLRCGFDEKKHGYINPCLDVIEDRLPMFGEGSEYKPVPFAPTSPEDPYASKCEIEVNAYDGTMYTVEDNEIFGDNTVVEFSYNPDAPKFHKWVPLRVRQDKTAELLSSKNRTYGNDFETANDNWQSIHQPVTVEMLETGKKIPTYLEDASVYYNKDDETNSTRGLRDFHNSHVKRRLIEAVSHKGDILIDYAVGMAGDFPKWIAAELAFVFGVDVSQDNIENRKNGACARYLNYRKTHTHCPSVLFVHGNSGLNIKSGEAIYSEKNKMITSAVFGNGPKDERVLGKGVYKNYGIGATGFNVSSCQFALHYFFENPTVLHAFIRNLVECTKTGGYFISTCYDGNSIFKLLKNKKSDMIVEGNRKIWEITKRYTVEEFEDNETSVGLQIDVFQETIGKTFPEYLVNSEYFIQLMKTYGFEIVDDAEAGKMGFRYGTGMFSELYKNQVEMRNYEKRISFLNRYFIFKKIHNVDAKKMAANIFNVQKQQTTVVEVEEKVVAPRRKLVLKGK